MNRISIETLRLCNCVVLDGPLSGPIISQVMLKLDKYDLR